MQFGYGLNYMVDVEHAVIVDVEATPARTYDEVAAARVMIERTEQRLNLKPHRLIADTVNRLRPGSATFIEVPKADHEIEYYASAEDAYAYRNPTVRPEVFAGLLLDWVKRVTDR